MAGSQNLTGVQTGTCGSDKSMARRGGKPVRDAFVIKVPNLYYPAIKKCSALFVSFKNIESTIFSWLYNCVQYKEAADLGRLAVPGFRRMASVADSSWPLSCFVHNRNGRLDSLSFVFTGPPVSFLPAHIIHDLEGESHRGQKCRTPVFSAILWSQSTVPTLHLLPCSSRP